MDNDNDDVKEYLEKSGVTEEDIGEMSTEELIEHAKILSKLMLEAMLAELHSQYDDMVIQASPFDQLRSILDTFEGEYNESLKPHLSVVTDEED